MPRRLTPRHRFQWRVAILLFALGAVWGFANGDALVGAIALGFLAFGLVWLRLARD